jgi:hypothetical protein
MSELISRDRGSEEDTARAGLKRERFGSVVRVLRQRRWSFPLLLLLPLLALTIMGIHGSSVGMYNRLLFGPAYEDPDLLFGKPQVIRSDEWLVVTPYIVSQANNGYPRVNPDLAYGQDMSLVVNVPYREWSVVFKPHNLAFLVLPLENAYAFQWWFLGYLLIVACYFFILELVPGRKKLAALLSVALFLSPFVQWWYQASVLATLAFSFFALIAFMRLLRTQLPIARAGWMLALVYVLTCFALIMYPPFQIATALAAGVFGAGYLIDHARRRGLRSTLPALGFLAAGIVVTGVIVATFFLTRLDTIRTILGTVYPGERVVETTGYPPSLLFSTHLLPLLQSSARAESYFANQSEASNFLFISPFLLVPSLYVLILDRRRGDRMDMPLAFVSVGIAVLTARMLIGGFDRLFALFLLDEVSSFRLLIGIGLLGFIQVALLHRRMDPGERPPPILAWAVATTAGTIFISTGFLVSARNPGFVSNAFLILALSLAVAAIIFLYSTGRFVAATVLLAAFSLGAVFRVNPLYQGLDPLTDSNLTKAMTSATVDDRAWIVVDDIALEQVPLGLGLRSFSGTFAYPQLDVWRVIDPGKKQEDIYNRYAHVVFVSDADSLELRAPDYFAVPFEGCSRFVTEHKIGYVLSPTLLDDDPCLTLESIVRYPITTLHIYTVM